MWNLHHNHEYERNVSIAYFVDHKIKIRRKVLWNGIIPSDYIYLYDKLSVVMAL